MPTPAQDLEYLEATAERFGKNDTVHWVAGHCPHPSADEKGDAHGRRCHGEGHPTNCDGAYETGDFQAFPARPTAKHVADAVDTMRADLSEALGQTLRLIKGLQQQVVALDRMVKTHRHKVGEGHFSERPEV